jgi:hypothetical protein
MADIFWTKTGVISDDPSHSCFLSISPFESLQHLHPRRPFSTPQPSVAFQMEANKKARRKKRNAEGRDED